MTVDYIDLYIAYISIHYSAVCFCHRAAKEMKTHNRTYSHLIRINTWRDSNK